MVRPPSDPVYFLQIIAVFYDVKSGPVSSINKRGVGQGKSVIAPDRVPEMDQEGRKYGIQEQKNSQKNCKPGSRISGQWNTQSNRNISATITMAGSGFIITSKFRIGSG